MSILGKIIGGIWGRAKSGPGHKPSKDEPAPAQAQTLPDAGAATAPQPHAPPAGGAASIQDVDVAGILDFMNDTRDQKLNWRTSIVDLMKLIGLESSLAERKDLARELGYAGDTSDTASMNIWLHKQVIQKIRDNGGRLPTEL